MAALRQEQIAAAQAMADQLPGLIDLQRHRPETAVLACARMAGTYLFRSFALALSNVTPGTVVLSHLANESGPNLIGLLGGALQRLDIRIDNTEVDRLAAEAPQAELPFLQTQPLLEKAFAPLRTSFGLSLEESAHAAAVAVAIFIRQQQGLLDANSAFGVAVYGFIEGSKTAPTPAPV